MDFESASWCAFESSSLRALTTTKSIFTFIRLSIGCYSTFQQQHVVYPLRSGQPLVFRFHGLRKTNPTPFDLCPQSNNFFSSAKLSSVTFGTNLPACICFVYSSNYKLPVLLDCILSRKQIVFWMLATAVCASPKFVSHFYYSSSQSNFVL